MELTVNLGTTTDSKGALQKRVVEREIPQARNNWAGGQWCFSNCTNYINCLRSQISLTHDSEGHEGCRCRLRGLRLSHSRGLPGTVWLYENISKRMRTNFKIPIDSRKKVIFGEQLQE
jgi:hypothetical protein